MSAEFFQSPHKQLESSSIENVHGLVAKTFNFLNNLCQTGRGILNNSINNGAKAEHIANLTEITSKIDYCRQKTDDLLLEVSDMDTDIKWRP